MQHSTFRQLYQRVAAIAKTRLKPNSFITTVNGLRLKPSFPRFASTSSLFLQSPNLCSTIPTRYYTNAPSPSSSSTSSSSADVVITPSAIKRILEIYAQEKNTQQALRVEVQAGGCSGYQLVFSFTEDYSKEDDVLLTSEGDAKVVLDTVSLGLLKGSTLDFVDELIGSRFLITDNPNAASKCGCGVSFEGKF